MKLDGRTIGIGILILIGAVILLPQLFNNPAAVNDPNAVYDEPVNAEDIQIGNPVSAAAIDRNGCPVNQTASFAANEDVYIVAPNTDVPAGTSVFVRLYHNGTPVEDAPEIQADQDYQNTCINFVFEPVDGDFDPGSYEAEFFINGNPADTIGFEIR